MSIIINNIKQLYTGTKYWFRIGGISSLFSHIFKFMVMPIYNSENYYLVRYDFNNISVAVEQNDILKNITIKVVNSPEEIDKIIKEGFDIKSFETSSRSLTKFKERVTAGAILFCAFLGNELVHTRWVCLTPKAKNCISTLPLAIDFSTEAYFGGAFTAPKYRGFRLHPYIFLYAIGHCTKMGVKTGKSLVLTDNLPSLSTMKKFGGIFYGELNERRFLRWKFVKIQIYENKMDIENKRVHYKISSATTLHKRK